MIVAVTTGLELSFERCGNVPLETRIQKERFLKHEHQQERAKLRSIAAASEAKKVSNPSAMRSML